MARSKFGSGEFLGVDSLDDSLARHHTAQPIVEKVDKADDDARRAKLLDELNDAKIDAASELAEMKKELDEAVRKHEEILEIGRRRERLGGEYQARDRHHRDRIGQITREIESASPKILTAAIDTIKKSIGSRDAAGRERAERAISRLQRLVLQPGSVDEAVRHILKQLSDEDIAAL